MKRLKVIPSLLLLTLTVIISAPVFAEAAPAAEVKPATEGANAEATPAEGAAVEGAATEPVIENPDDSHKKEDEHAFSFSHTLEHHLMDGAPIIKLNWHIGGVKKTVADESEAPKGHSVSKDENGNLYYYEGGIDMSITRRVLVMIVVAVLLVLIFTLVARRIAADPYKKRGRFINAMEALIQFVRNDIVEANMGHHAKGYHHYILTLFFFILGCNLFGLLPNIGETFQLAADLVSGSPTDHADSWFIHYLLFITSTVVLGVTGTLAIITYFMIWFAGFKHQGPLYVKNVVPKGVPVALWPIMWPIEFVVSPLAKSFSLMVRLFANMTGGHVIILALLGMIFQFQNGWIGLGSVPGSVAIYLLEIFVSFLQAYIFSLLTAMFVGAAFHRH